MDFKPLIQSPGYIFKFGIYLLFIVFALLLFFKDIEGFNDKSLKNIYSVTLFLYGSYRMIRTYQEFKAEIREKNQED